MAVYESNRKHKEPWQPGARGSLCPPDVHPVAQKLLDESRLLGNKRYAIYERKPFCGQQHAEGRWHGYPVMWREVPEPVRRKWLSEGKIVRRDLKT